MRSVSTRTGHGARSRLATGLAGLSVAACLAWATDARAAACCGEASALGDRLSAAEVTAISTSLSGRGRIGSFDEDGEYFPASIDDIDVRFQLAADAAVRVSSWLEVGATVPVVVNLRGSDGHAEAGGSFGDVTARARASIASSDQHQFAPGLSALVGVVIPTGVPASASTDNRLSDVTGQGDGEIVLGLTTDKVFEGVLLARVDGSVGLFLPSSVDAERVQRAPRLTLSAMVGPVLRGVALAAGVTYEAEAPPSTAPQGEAARTQLQLVASTVADVTPTMAVLASVRSSLPAKGAGTNEIASTTAALGLRVAVHGL